MTTKKLLVGNWKMNLGIAKSQELLAKLAPSFRGLKKSEVWVAPSYTSLDAVAETLQGTGVRVGAQNVHWQESGAFTGELSVGMLKEVGCTFALTGHSERRHGLLETSEIVAKRTLAPLKSGFTIILCIGEVLAEREKGETMSVLKSQLAPVLKEITPDMAKNLVLAYEPVWAIGTGKVASVAEIKETSDAILAHWKSTLGYECPPLLYGGSVDNTNAGEILSVASVGGCLIGGASIHPEKFPAIISSAEKLS